ncbi:mCpol domain-containing protein [Gottfriedia acidiceleris]|uniref:mCpol domain-containing protein n=1 Tax=Gottfriedia acidiceleris TaxID=371036 RepID=UPI000B44B923|nr:mCpol domain-containing protein [Gottfriedia acidiceleris]
MFISIDGNNVGKFLEGYIINEDLVSLESLSENIKAVVLAITNFIKNQNGEVYLSGGDNVLGWLPEENEEKLISFLKEINKNSEIKFSAGSSKGLKETYLALKYSKSLGNPNLTIVEIENNKIQFKIIEI